MVLTELQREILAAILERAVAAREPELAWDEGQCADLEHGEPPLKATGEYWDERNSRILREAAARTRMRLPTWLTTEEIGDRRGTIDPEAIPVEIIAHGRPALVYNVTQTRGLSDQLWRHAWEIRPVNQDPRNRNFERYVATLDVAIHHTVRRPRKGSRAAYREDIRRIRIPPFDLFYSAHDYYLTLAHELVHWADHTQNLVGDLVHLGDDEYAWREMVAEFGAAFICAELGLSVVPRDRTVAYIEDWRDDGGFNDAEVHQAAQDAARAVAWLVHSAPGWRADAEETARQARPEPHFPPASRSHQSTTASAQAAAAVARRFVADAFALERLIEGKDRGDDWAREAARLLKVARTIDLGIPAVEAAVVLETSFHTPRPSACAWLKSFQARTKRICDTQSLMESAETAHRGRRITP